MKNKEISNESKALMFIVQTLDKALTRGAYNRKEVLEYNQALIELEDFLNKIEEPKKD